MLLVWGRKWYTRKLGFVADFCEICRRPQPFTLERRSLIGHFWYLPMGTTHAVHHRGRCTRCATDLASGELGSSAGVLMSVTRNTTHCVGASPTLLP